MNQSDDTSTNPIDAKGRKRISSPTVSPRSSGKDRSQNAAHVSATTQINSTECTNHATQSSVYLNSPSARRLQNVDLSTVCLHATSKSSLTHHSNVGSKVLNFLLPPPTILSNKDAIKTPLSTVDTNIPSNSFVVQNPKFVNERTSQTTVDENIRKNASVQMSSRPQSTMTFSGRKQVNRSSVSLISPSAARLQNVDLSSIPSPKTRNSNVIRNDTNFQLPTSTISSTKVSTINYSSMSQFQRNYSHVHVNSVEAMQDLHGNASHPFNSNVNKYNYPTFNVTVPLPSQLPISLPAWMSDTTSHENNVSQQASNIQQTMAIYSENSSSDAVKNLIDSFNYVADHTEVDLVGNNDPQEGPSEDDDSDLDSLRGEYISDDEIYGNLELSDNWERYMNLGKPEETCSKCQAKMWNEERNNKAAKSHQPTFSLCCRDGQVELHEEKQPPPYLASLLNGNSKTKHFK